jgi:hypothetical protein
MILAGGLHAANVVDAIARVRPWGVDVSSGVESSPGIKDPALVAAFVAAARRASKLEGAQTMNSTAIRREDAAGQLEALLDGRLPDARGRFGPWGGRFVPETLVPALDRLQAGVAEHLHSAEFQACLGAELRDWVGRPTALTPAPRLSEAWGAELWLKREDLAHTGAHKINNALGQAMLAKMLGAQRMVAETGAGQHGVASAAACARIGLPCLVYMGEIDCERQALNVDRMRRLGAEVVPVTSGDRTLRAPSTRRCATGCPTRRAPTTCSARWSGRIPIPTWCASCRR